MPELTPNIFETIFFKHIKNLTLGHGRCLGQDKVQLRLQSFDYQFSDQWVNQHPGSR